MRSESPPLLPIFRSRHQADLLTFLYLHPERELTLTELADRVGTPLTTLQREVGRLLQAGLLTSRRVGRAHLLRANTASRYARPLAELLTLAFGPHIVIAEEFADVVGAEAVGLFGSWAARYRGEIGPPPNDIDVFIIGRPDRTDVYDAAERAERRLGIVVNPVLVSRSRWEEDTDPLVRQVRSSPVVWVNDIGEGVD